MKSKRIIILTTVCSMFMYGCSAVSSKPSVNISSGDHYLEYGFDPYDTEEELHPEIMKFISSHKGDLSADFDDFDCSGYDDHIMCKFTKNSSFHTLSTELKGFIHII